MTKTKGKPQKKIPSQRIPSQRILRNLRNPQPKPIPEHRYNKECKSELECDNCGNLDCKEARKHRFMHRL